jgi:hypothetical protein
MSTTSGAFLEIKKRNRARGGPKETRQHPTNIVHVMFGLSLLRARYCATTTYARKIKKKSAQVFFAAGIGLRFLGHSWLRLTKSAGSKERSRSTHITAKQKRLETQPHTKSNVCDAGRACGGLGDDVGLSFARKASLRCGV